MAELGTGKSVVVLAIVVGCFSILWPKIFYPMMQSALSLTAPKYDGEDGRCQFMLDAEATGYAFFANLCHELASREQRKQKGDEEQETALSPGLDGRCRTALRAVCRIELPPLPFLEGTTAVKEVIGQSEAERKSDLTRCLLELVKQKKRRRQIKKRKNNFDFFGIEGPSRHPPHLHLPPRMREAMGEARPDLPPLHPSAHQQPQRGAPHLMKDGRPFPHPSARQPPKPQPKTGGAMSIVMPIYTIGIVGFFLYTLLKLVFKKRNEETEQPIIPNYHMDPRYHRYILGQDRPNNNNVKPTTTAPQTATAVSSSSKTFLNESKTKRFLEEFGKQKVELLDDEKDLEILQLKRKLQETEDTLQQILERVSENMNRAVATPIPTITTAATTANDTPGENFGETTQEAPLGQRMTENTEGSKVEDIEDPALKEKLDLLEGDMNQKDLHSTNSSPDTESYELIGSHEDSGRSESEGSENATSTTLRQRFVHDPNTISDDRDMNRNGSYKLSDILQF